MVSAEQVYQLLSCHCDKMPQARQLIKEGASLGLQFQRARVHGGWRAESAGRTEIPHFKLQAEGMRVQGTGGGFSKLWPSLQWHTYSNKETLPNPSQTVPATGNQVLQTLKPIRKWLVSTTMDLYCRSSRISLPGHWYDGKSVHSWVKISIIHSSSLHSVF